MADAIFAVKVATLFEMGTGVAIFGAIDEQGNVVIDENAYKRVIGTGLDAATGDLVPVCWQGQAYVDPRTLPGFLGIEFDDEDDEDDEEEEDSEGDAE